ncbi:hypothetical protein [Shimwellia blattae]|uniref:Cytoplasmic protein n=1 Tax=Shimwellia blattae (strain ATCC 29907 / DSM 4481 / JCM 1650 / NBRC 105725 / CDC 9005-74) TaxID=630626 RepID=I2B650_SHIBC|nr:hypothetical protein [Shimwellia blattae]AFJ46004.1 hypothetical protein EBL_c08840 [Shimwellia blattae DSM 4481 = NBRC 105725]GAB82717.1 hypothetical protein EB105725_32_00120 [Shimwellia blattae DSM 4481 = NBRC 105725]VDY63480.1 Uncharacterised protein [Shimwellia blattae]VEC21417.1 Uncharacterised protein [Shimwellia blattae]
MSGSESNVRISDVIPNFIDTAVNFMASTQAFREYLHNAPRTDITPAGLSDDKARHYFECLSYYREIYQPVSRQR